MQDFLDFYQFGGFFNHVVSLFALAALTTIVMHAVGPQNSDPRLLRLSDRLGALAIAAGVLGTLFNVIEMGAALATIDADLVTAATHRALTIVPIPLAWSLLCAIPVWVATACLRHRMPALAHE
jgi:hypothetical protein